MTQLNETFIRAFEKKRRPGTLPGSAPARRSPRATEGSVRRAILPPADADDSTSDNVSRPAPVAVHFVDTPENRGPAAPHLRVLRIAPGESEGIAPEAAVEVEPETPDEPHVLHYPGTRAGNESRDALARQDQAASAFDSADNSSDDSSDSDVVSYPSSDSAPDVMRPLWQVEQFIWPALCDRWLEASPAQFDALAKLLVEGSRRGQRVVAVSSCRSGEGRTSLLLALARLLGRSRVRVAIVDGDFDEPGLANRLGLAPTIGWVEALEQQLSLAEVLIESVADNLTLLPQLDPAVRPRITDQAAIEQALAQLRTDFDLVLIDTSPVETVGYRNLGELPPLWNRADALLLVSDSRHSSPEALQTAARTVRAAGVNVLGVVENYVGSD